MIRSTFESYAMRHILGVLSLLTITGAQAQTDIIPSSVDVRLVQGADPTQLLVQVRTHSTANFGGILSALTVTIRYDAASGASLGNGTSFCNMWSPFTPSPAVVNAGTTYRTYNGFGANRLEDPVVNGGCATSMVPEQWTTITTIVVSGSGCTAFTLGNDAWTTANNRNFYISMGGQNVTGAVVSGAVNGGNCVLDCLGVAGGTALPGTSCNDGNANTANDTWNSSCVCVGTVICTAPIITGTTSNSPVCSGNNLSLGVTVTGSAPLIYAWSGTGTYSPNANAANVTVSGAASGSYQITVTNACGNANASVNVTINNAPSASIAYGGSPYCSGSGTASVTRTGSAGGTYSAIPAGLSIDPTSGAITLGTSSVNTYTVTYSIAASGGCSAFSTTASVTINNAPGASIAYGGSPYCNGSGTASVTRTGSAGGSYSAIPAGLSIDPTTGAITLGTSTVGTYTVTYSIAANGGCSAFSTTAQVVLTNSPSASIAYPDSPYCGSGGTASVTRTGSAGGTYAGSPSGLALNSTTGAINLANSDPGNYTVIYTIAAGGGCSVFQTTTTLVITSALSATIAYTGSPYCSSGGSVSVTRTGSGGGTYSATPAGLSINPTSGVITLATSTVGTYTVTYSIAANGGCSAFSTTAQVVVTSSPSASIAYTGSPYCGSGGTVSVTRTGSADGTYAGSPSGLALNSTTGAINLANSDPGNYTVIYTIAAGGGCSVFQTTTTLVITSALSATIAYTGSPYCSSGGSISVTRTGSGGGTYSATPAGLSINPTSGVITLGTSTVGTYAVTYSIVANGGCSAFSTTTQVVVTSSPSATITYTDSPYCLSGGTASVTRTGSAGGTYVGSPSGLALNSTTGAINLTNSDPGNYTVIYIIAAGGGCSVFQTTTTLVLNAETTWYADADGDGVGATNNTVVACTQPSGYVPIGGDGCPNDPDKIAAGACGCGIPDIDTDLDGAADCIDGCPNDPNKTAPGTCGCGIPDTDSDLDGAADCIDGCPNDPNKTAPGVCGCGIPDTDTDQDGLADCVDNCPDLAGVIGDACDDGDSTTVMDQITEDCQCVGTISIGISNIVAETGIDLWPNPTADRAFTIRMQAGAAGETIFILVQDASGRKIFARSGVLSGTKEFSVQLPNRTASGLYVVEVKRGEDSYRLPLMCR